MTIPDTFKSSKYPAEFDTDQNLHLVHDSLRVVLAEDYNPNIDATKIIVDGDTSVFPDTGIVTLTEQCSDITNRAVSFFYTLKTDSTFEGLVMLDGFTNTIVRPKRLTEVTQNVMAKHHNSLKDALIAIETFVGVKGVTDVKPFGNTMEGRINFLRKMVLSPRAWFTANKHVGLVPLEVVFNNQSFRMGDGTVNVTWDFGDQSSNVSIISTLSIISTTSVVPISATDVRVTDLDSGTISKTYTHPNKYTVSLTVENQYGSDTITFEDFINARIEAPQEAIIDFVLSSDQTTTVGLPTGGPFTTPPTIRSRTNKFVNMAIDSGVNPFTNRTYAGEAVIGLTPIDPIESYNWSLTDDLTHPNQNSAKASYSIGGLYDLVLRCDTQFGAYRITTYRDCIDIIEQRNLWLFTKQSTTAHSNEFGLISETFKTGNIAYTVLSDDSFLTGTNNFSQAKKEFAKNTGFTINGAIDSGDHGTAVLAYSSGGGVSTTLAAQTVKLVQFEGFGGTFTNSPVSITRPWNWLFLPFAQKSYFLFGPNPSALPNENTSYQNKDTLDLGGIALEPPITLVSTDNYINGAQELINHVSSSYDISGEPLSGRFAVYRSAVKDSTGYFIRNDGVGNFFKLRNFYRTEGTESTNPVINIRKMQDMSGPVKTEGELVGLNSGIFFFNNSGNISAFNVVNSTWEIGNSTAPFRTFQDINVNNFSDTDNKLLAASDGDHIAYLSFDYSPNAFTKYNSVDQTFSAVGQRVTGTQWIMGIY